MSNAKRAAILSGIGLMTLASSWILGGCGNPNNVVPPPAMGGMTYGSYGCPNGQMTSYAYNYGGMYQCPTGSYLSSGNICCSMYQNGGYYNGYYPYAGH